MRYATSIFTDVVTVHAGAEHRSIAPGEVVDLDEIVGARTLGDALGSMIDGFAIDKPVKKSDTKKTAADVPAAKE